MRVEWDFSDFSERRNVYIPFRLECATIYEYMK